MTTPKGTTPHLRLVDPVAGDGEPVASDDDSGAERRLAMRVLVDLEVDCETEENYLFASITDISSTGIFIHTNEPEAAGTRLNLRFAGARRPRPGDAANDQHDHAGLGPLTGDPADPDHGFELEGCVAWVNPLRPGQPDNLHPGMGVRFLGLEPEDHKRLLRLIRRIAYLPDAT